MGNRDILFSRKFGVAKNMPSNLQGTKYISWLLIKSVNILILNQGRRYKLGVKVKRFVWPIMVMIMNEFFLNSTTEVNC